MIKFFRFSPSRLALVYIALSVLALALFAIPLWYAWRVNISTFREYVQGEDIQRLVDVFHRDGAKGLITAMESQVKSLPGDRIMVLADASKLRLAGNLPMWPAEVPDESGTYGLVIGLGDGSTMRVVASHVTLPGGYHLLLGRESVRFESLVERFWYGIAAVMAIVLVLGAAIGWLIRRALLAEVEEISRAASAIVQGNLSRRVAERGGSNELDTLARTVNGMLEQLSRQNLQLEEEIAVRRQAEQALHRAHDDLEGLVEHRTAQLARVNESLRRSETYLAEAQRLSLTGSFGWNVATGELFWSDETYALLGFDRRTKPTLDAVLRRVHPEDLAFVQDTLGQATRECERLDFEHRLLLDDGSVRHLHVRARAAKDASDAVEYVGAVTDVTALRRSQQALETAFREVQSLNEEFRLAVDTIPGLVWSTLPDGHADFLNQRWLEYTGLSLKEALGSGWKVAFHPDDYPTLDRWRASLAAGESFEAEARMRRVDGEYCWFLIRFVPLRDEKGNIVKWYGTNTDIQDRKRAEALLAGEKRLLEMIAKGNSLAVILDGLCRLVEELSSGSLASILLLDASDNRLRHGAAPGLPRSYIEAIDGSVIGPAAGSCGTAAYRREPVIVSDIATDPLWADYRELALPHGLRACWSTPIPSSDGRVLGTFAIYSDEPSSPTPQQQNIIEQVTDLASIAVERKHAEDALHHAQAELAHVTRVATLGEMTASIAHEINQPLAAVVNNASACLRWLAASNLEEARQSAALVVADGHRAGEIIGRIRALAKKAPPQKNWLDINATIREVIALASSELHRSGVALETQLSDDVYYVPLILADRIQLQQVILNLIINAIEAMSGAGDGPRELLIRSGTDESKRVLVTVRDSGPGLDPKSLNRLFDAFYTTKPHGLGMGLAICRSIVEAHGGRLWATASESRGAVFQFTLPTGGERTS